MTVQSITTLKSYFETGDYPTQSQFGDFIDTLNSASLYYNAEVYGLSTSNSAAANKTALQAAIDAAEAAGGGMVVIPIVGTINLDNSSSPITIQSTGVSIVGVGRTTRLAFNTSGNDGIVIGNISSSVFRCAVRNLRITGCNNAVYLGYNTAQCYVDDLYISSCAVGVLVQGDYTQNPILDSINHHITRIEGEGITSRIIKLYMCGDIYIKDVQSPSPGASAFGLLIESGTTAVYAQNCNFTSCKGGVIIRDNLGISPNPTSLPTTPRQMYFYNMQGDGCSDFGIQIENGYQINFVDSWASGCTGGDGWVIGNSSDSIQQIALIGCRALGNYKNGFKWVSGNTRLDSQMIGCHALSNGTSGAGTYDGIAIEATNAGLIIDGCNSFNDTVQGLNNVQRYGIYVNAGAITNVVISNCNLNGANGNLSGAISYNSTSHTGNTFTNNIGFNTAAYAVSPSMPSSTTVFTNPYARPFLVYVNGGTVSAIKVDTITIAIATGAVFYLGAVHTVSITYSVTPNWSWVGM